MIVERRIIIIFIKNSSYSLNKIKIKKQNNDNIQNILRVFVQYYTANLELNSRSFLSKITHFI